MYQNTFIWVGNSSQSFESSSEQPSVVSSSQYRQLELSFLELKEKYEKLLCEHEQLRMRCS